MALAYTAPTWTDGSGEGISASNLQAISNCIEGLVQGSDKAVHAVSIEGSVITLTYADGTQESFNAVDLKGIVDVTEVVSDLNHNFTMTFTDGTVFTFTIKDGRDGSSTGDMLEADYDPNEDVKDAGGIPDYVSSAISGKANTSALDEWTTGVQTLDGTTFVFDNLSDSYGYDLYGDDKLYGISSLSKTTGTNTGTIKLTYTVSGASIGDYGYLRILK